MKARVPEVIDNTGRPHPLQALYDTPRFKAEWAHFMRCAQCRAGWEECEEALKLRAEWDAKS